MLTFFIKMICAALGLTSFVLLSMGNKDSNRYPEKSGRASFEDAQYVQIRDTGTEVKSDDPQ